MDPFKRWTRESGYLLPRAAAVAPSHLLLNGGRLQVRGEDNRFFLLKYAKSLDKGDRPYVVELRTPVFKLMFDLDIKTPTPLSLDQQTALCRHIQTDVRRVFSGTSTGVMCTSPSKDVGGLHKTGIHLVFPQVLVNSSVAMAFRAFLLQTCKVAFPQLGQWEDILDPAVYTSAGLRMIGSKKVDGPTFYQPTFLVSDISITDVVMNGWKEMVQATSIRTFQQDGTPLIYQLDFPPSSSRKTAQAKVRQLDMYEEGLTDLKLVLPEVYRDVTFTGLKAAGNKYFLQTASHHCLNADREHNSATVWFQLQHDGCYQRCHSHKSGGGRYKGGCKTFYSNLFPMPESLKQSLWPSDANKKAKSAFV